ncbi:MAG TPA: AAA family ATPase [Acidimicrobiia bacterium]|jgi:DNA-binding CsgD family transcriptional regulator
MSMDARPAPVLVGRQQELALLLEALTAAVAGVPRVVSVEGDAGAGKTALVRAALAQIGGKASVVRLHGDELVQSVPFEGLAPWLDPAADTEVFQVGRDILSRLDEIAPAVLVVEDLHWVDIASRKALAIAAGRLSHEPVAILTTARPMHDGLADGWGRIRQDASRCDTVRLDTLNWSDVTTLAAHNGIALDADAAQRLTEHTGGNPLYVTTLLQDVPAHILRAPGRALPVPTELASVVAAKVNSLDHETASFLGALAVMGRPTSLPRLGQVAGITAPAASFARAAIAKLVEQTNVGDPGPDVVSFVHPLIGRSVYDNLTAADRRSLHLAAAQASDRRSALTHRVAAADRVDDPLAAELEAESVSARADHGTAAAAQWLRWASDLSSAPHDRERRLIQAAHLLLLAGDPSVADLAADIELCSDTPARDLVAGQLAWQKGDTAESASRLRRAATSSDDSIAVEALVRLAQQMVLLVRPDEAINAVTAAIDLGITDPSLERQAWAMLAMGVGEREGAVAGLELVQDRLPEPAKYCAPVDTDLLAIRGLLTSYALRFTAAIDDLTVTLDRPIATLQARRRAHVDLAQCQLALGQWNEAMLNARRALELSDEQHQWQRAVAHQILASVAAGRGRWDEAELQLDMARGVADTFGSVEAALAVRLAAITIADAHDSVAGDIASVRPSTPMLSMLTLFHPTAVAQIASGAFADAEATIEMFEHQARERRVDVAAKLGDLRARLAVRRGDANDADEQFRSALAAITSDTPVLIKAGIHHGYGRFLRSQLRRHDAIGALRTARSIYASLDASPYVDRVDDDLTASGLSRPTKRRDRSPLDLTPREQDVVTLVIGGHTNREVAAALFISAKAVEYHLRNVYGKVGVSSRRDLAAKLAASAS